jgi:serine/threonine-protein kinase HipA
VSYPQILDVLRLYAKDATQPGPELFRRIAMNIAISNNDDHARNHAAFWDGTHLELTPAYDLAPGQRSGDTFEQAMAFGRGNPGAKVSNFAALLRESVLPRDETSSTSSCRPSTTAGTMPPRPRA